MVYTNTTLKNIGTALEGADSVLLFSHVNPDGDAVGACGAVCRLLRKMGKSCWIMLEDALPQYVSFITGEQARNHPEDTRQGTEVCPSSARQGTEVCPADPGRDPYGPMETMDLAIIPQPDICMCIDCHEVKRFPKREALFLAGKETFSIDHHQPKVDCPWDQYWIDPEAPAAALLIWQLFKEMNWPIDRFTAEALFIGISTDTGSFQYSSVTPDTFRIAADLMEHGVDINAVSVEMYQNTDPKTIAVETIGMQNLELISDGSGAISCISMKEMDDVGAEMEHTEEFVENIRSIRGVEMSAFLRETDDGIRVSLRSKNEANVGAIAQHFGGGGHVKAAGCTIHEPLQEAFRLVRAEMNRTLEALRASKVENSSKANGNKAE